MSTIFWASILSCVAISRAQASEDPYELPAIVAVENKKFNPRHDLTLQLGILPLDAFYKGLQYGFSYTYGWKNYLRWEALNANMVTTQDTGLKSDLVNDFHVSPKGLLDSVKSYATTNIIYTPIYSKNLFFNETVFHGEFSFLAGGGVVNFTSGTSAPMVGGGIVLRYFWSESSSFKFDGRVYVHSAPEKNSNMILMITIAHSIELGSGGNEK